MSSSNKPWINSYPKGVPQEINPDSIRSVVDLLDESVKKYSNRVAFRNMGVDLTYSELDQLSTDMASFFQNKAGLKKGDRVIIQMPNLIQYPIVLFGALRAGLIIVNTNPLYTSREMLHQFNDSGATAIVILANFAHMLEEILPQTKIKTVVVTQIGDQLGFPKSLIINSVVKYIKKMVPAYTLKGHFSFYEALDIGASAKLKPVPVSNTDLAFLQYTGGTTGVSKGAELTHRNVIANMLQIAAWMKPLLKEGQETIITALPLYHIFSLTVNCLSFMYLGNTNLLVTNPKDIPGFIKLLRTEKYTVFAGVNTLFNALMNHPDFTKINFSQLKISVAGATALQKAVADRWKDLTKTPIVEGYGLTETSPVACCNPIDGTDRLGTVGLPVPSTLVALKDESGNFSKEGERGEICVQGPQVMRGYWQRPEETANAIKNGWLHTGDVGVFDSQGFLKIVDRIKDMILVSGFNVYPNEVEDVVTRHPKVLEAAAVGVPDDKTGEAIKLFVVKKGEVTEDEIIAFCRKDLVAYKVPKQIAFKTELPKTNVGKILRRALRDT
jgi:long-chain acyl-CoA synthetase